MKLLRKLVKLGCLAIAWGAALDTAYAGDHPPFASASLWQSDGRTTDDHAWALPSSSEADVPLSEDERRWLATLPVLRIGIDPTAAPLSMIGRDGEAEGLSIDYLEAALHALGLRTRTVPTTDWHEAVRAASAGDIDVLPAASARNAELGRHFIFSAPYAEFPVMIVTREDFATIGDSHDLAGRHVAANLSQGAVAAAVKAIPGVGVIDVRTTADGLQAVATGTAEAYVGDIATAEALIRRDYPAKLKLAAPTNERAELTVAVSARYAPLVPLIDRALARLPERRSQSIRNTWLRSHYTWGGSWTEIARKVGPAGVLALLLLMAVSYAYLQLRRETRRRVRSEAQLADVTRHMPAVVYRFMYRTDGPITFIYVGGNPEPMFGIDAETILRDERRAFERVDERDQSSLLAAMAQSAATLQPLHAELRVRDVAPERWVASHALPRRVGDAVEFTGYWIDVSERHRQSSQLASAKLAAEAATQAKSRFLATMSHEIRTPMHGVLGTLEILGETELDEAQRRLLTTAESSAEALLQILDDVLDFSRIEAGRVLLDPSPVDIRSLVSGVIDLHRWQAGKKGLRLGTRIDPRLAACLLVDSSRLRQILLNLVSNAVKFTEEGGVELTVDVVEDAHEVQAVRFCIGDTGIGVAADDIERLFSPFSQAEASTARRFGGSGLGLTISRSLVELLHGQIAMSGSPGQGTRVTVDLSLPVCEATSPTHTVPEPTGTVARTCHVLVAEDHAINRELVAAQLERLGHPYRIANDGAEALAIAGQWRVDVLLTDIHMPVMDGHELIRALRERGETMRIVAMTADVMATERDRCLADGVDAFVTKPLRLATLRDAIVPPADEPQTTSDSWDFDLWRETFGDLTALPAMVDRFAAGLRHDVGELRAAATPGAAGERLHRILGGMRIFGVSPEAISVEALQRALVSGTGAEDAMARLADVPPLLDRFVARLRDAVQHGHLT
ncbi:transporter substrate-binding domain-containing protein [Luteibacter sp. 22Crub2.1]|uniref:ATP-binding protein n=1 Tax=Luteibacter sp. 22Crub2.1 TaxID=1283288 RepID=UPI0009A87B5C|nr:transporter substrate-binding domain-containing protein [Luteibacter sp. 22Crub2.1]SKB97596.1 two-component system, NarL family, sensor histidine kinase EvgS [Luteibacter sp. 22Crub2.1]